MVAVVDDCFDGQFLQLVMVIVAGVFVVVDVAFGGVGLVWILVVAEFPSSPSVAPASRLL